MRARSRCILTSRGFSLVEVLIAAGIFGLLMLGAAGMFSSYNQKSQKFIEVNSLSEAQENIIRTLLDDQAWESTIRRDTNILASGVGTKAADSEMDCLIAPVSATRLDCRGKGGRFILYDGSGYTSAQYTAQWHSTGNVVFDGRASVNTTSGYGLTSSGKSCTYVTATPTSACPYRFFLAWSAICQPTTSGEPCFDPLVKITGTFTYSPDVGAPVDQKTILNMKNLNFVLYRNPSKTRFNTPTMGQTMAGVMETLKDSPVAYDQIVMAEETVPAFVPDPARILITKTDTGGNVLAPSDASGVFRLRKGIYDCTAWAVANGVFTHKVVLWNNIPATKYEGTSEFNGNGPPVPAGGSTLSTPSMVNALLVVNDDANQLSLVHYSYDSPRPAEGNYGFASGSGITDRFAELKCIRIK